MKIIAYSKVPGTTPFVHLGYLSAGIAMTKPVEGLLFGGLVLLVAGFGLGLRGVRLLGRRGSPEVITAGHPRRLTLGRIRIVLLLAGSLAIVSGLLLATRERQRVAARRSTSIRVNMYSCAIAEPDRFAGLEASRMTLPVEEGMYQLSAVWNTTTPSETRYLDAWNTPMWLRVTRVNDVMKYVVVSAGPDRTLNTPDDITSAKQPQ